MHFFSLNANGSFICLRVAFRGINRGVSFIRRSITYRCINRTTTSQLSFIRSSAEVTNGMENYVVSMTASRLSVVLSCVENIYNGMTSDEGRKEMFYLTTHSTHFIYCYMASDTNNCDLISSPLIR